MGPKWSKHGPKPNHKNWIFGPLLSSAEDPPLGPSGPPAVRAAGEPGQIGGSCGERQKLRSGPRSGDPVAGEPSGAVRDSSGESRRASKNTIFCPISGRFGAHLGHQSTFWWLRMASWDFSVYFWHYKCPFWCKKPGFQAIFLGFLRAIFRKIRDDLNLDPRETTLGSPGVVLSIL